MFNICRAWLMLVMLVVVMAVGGSAVILFCRAITMIDIPVAVTNTLIAVICVVMTVYSLYIVSKPDSSDPVCKNTKIINKE